MSGIHMMLMAAQNFQVLNGFTIRAEIVGIASPNITFNANGTCTTSDGSNQPWGAPTTSGVGSGYWVNVAAGTGAGTASGATRGSWLSLASGQTYGINAAATGQVRSRTGTYSIASDSGGVTVVGGGSYSLVDDNS